MQLGKLRTKRLWAVRAWGADLTNGWVIPARPIDALNLWRYSTGFPMIGWRSPEDVASFFTRAESKTRV